MHIHTFTEHYYVLVLIQEGVWYFWRLRERLKADMARFKLKPIR